jgi:RNA polymerase sigma factor (sigma-70 family)
MYVAENWVEGAYAKYSDDLVRFATGLVGPEDAADLVSAVMVRVLARPSDRAVQNRRAYLFRAVLNEARMHHRATMRRRAREALAVSPDLTTDNVSLRPDVLTAVSALSVRQRAVVVLRYWGDLDESETAALLGISRGSVRKHLARAHVRLRRTVSHD